MSVLLINVHLTGTHPMRIYFIGACLMGVHLTGMRLMGMYLMSVHLTGVCHTGMYLIGVHLTGVHLARVSIPMQKRKASGIRPISIGLTSEAWM